jgi:single-strand DNA-binding protein
MNKVCLMGRLCADVELRSTTTGKSVCGFALAVDRRGKDAGTDFVDCAAWEKTAEFISHHFSKGSRIAITGRLQTRNYEDKNGSKRKVTEVVVEEVFFCDSKSQNSQQASEPMAPLGFASLPGDNGDLPF